MPQRCDSSRTRRLLADALTAAVCNPGQQVDIIGELREVLEGKSGGAFNVSVDDQRRDLDNLAFAPRVRTGVPLRAGDVAPRAGRVAALRGDEGDEGVLDRVHPGGLRRLSVGVMTADCARWLTRS